MRLSTAITTLCLSASALAATAADWRSRSIYQVITDRFARADGSTTAPCNTGDGKYCGGSWQGIIKQLDYIQGMRFTAIWISPVTFNVEGSTAWGEAYHGYWQQDLYRLNSHFGSVADLKALSSALHSRGMYLMVDIVVNHNGWNGAPDTIQYTNFNPFNSADDYHSYCTIDYNDENSVQHCWVGDDKVPLPDLKTESPAVAQGYQTWIKQLVSNYSIDGLRMDTARQVDTAFWPGFREAAGVFITGEVFEGNIDYVCKFQGYMGSVLNYPAYFSATSAFSSTSGSIQGLVNEIDSMKSTCSDTTTLGSFSENHDNVRFPSITSDMSLVQNMLAFTILQDGIPIIYQGQEQHFSGSSDPSNREAVWLSGYNRNSVLYKLIANLNQARNQATYVDASYLTYKNWVIYSDTTTVAMRKGFDGKQLITVLSNKGANGAAYTLTLGNTGFTAGMQVMEMLTCTTVTADSNGNIVVPMANGLPRVYYPKAALASSGICGQTASAAGAAATATSRSTSTLVTSARSTSTLATSARSTTTLATSARSTATLATSAKAVTSTKTVNSKKASSTVSATTAASTSKAAAAATVLTKLKAVPKFKPRIVKPKMAKPKSKQKHRFAKGRPRPRMA